MMKSDLVLIEEIKKKLGTVLQDAILGGVQRRVLLYTHFDLDGITPIILLNQFDNLEIEYQICPRDANCCMDDINNCKWDLYTDILFVDISVNEEVAKCINCYINATHPSPNIVLLDHHSSAINLNSKDWALVIPHDLDNHIVTSGTWLLYLYLQEAFSSLDNNLEVHDFARMVAYYDTFYFKRIDIRELYPVNGPEELNLLCQSMEKKEFIDLMISSLKKYTIFDIESSIVIKTIKKIVDKECWKQYYNVRICKIGGRVIGFIYCDSYISQVASFIYEKFPEIDIVCTINMNKNTISLRTKKDIDLAKQIAIPNGGGGHPQACGFNIDGIGREVLSEYIVGKFNSIQMLDQFSTILKDPDYVDEDKNLLLSKYLNNNKR